MENPETQAVPVQAKETFREKWKRFDWSTLVAALAMIVIGVVILAWPDESSKVLVYVVAGLVAAAGIARTVLYFVRHERAGAFSVGGLSVGLTLLTVGVLLLLDPDVLIVILPMALGCLLVFSGYGSLQKAVELIRLKIKRWYIPLIFALVSLACGLIALLNPFSAARVLMVFLGIALCGEALLLLVSVFLFRNDL